MSVLTVNAKYLAIAAITLMMSSTSLAVFSGPLESLECREIDSGKLMYLLRNDGQSALKNNYYEPTFKDALCGKGSILRYLVYQNEILATMNDQDNNSMLRELGAAFRKYRPDANIKSLVQYCKGEASLNQALDGVNYSGENDFGKAITAITDDYGYSHEGTCYRSDYGWIPDSF